MSERGIVWCVITNQNAKSQGSNLCAQPLQETKTAVGSLQYKHVASGAPVEPSPVMLEKPDLAWECCSHPSQGKPPQHSKPQPLPHQGPGSPKVKADDSQGMDAQQMRVWLGRAYPNTLTQLPSPRATLRVANSCNFTASLAILCFFFKAW